MSRIIINNYSDCSNAEAMRMVGEIVGYGKEWLGLKGSQYQYRTIKGKYLIVAKKNKLSDSFTITQL